MTLADQMATQTALAGQFDLARRYCAARDYIAAERVCRQILRTAPGDPQVVSLLGHILWSQGRCQDTIALLQPFVGDHSDAGGAHFSLGNALHAVGRHADAVMYLRRAAELQPHFAGAHCNLGLALAAAGDKPGAIHAYVRALRLDPNLWQARGALGMALLDVGKPEDAIVQFRKAEALNPTIVNNLLHLGLALEKTGKVEEAINYYRRVVALEPKSTDGWIGLGSALRVMGNFTEAAAAFEEAVAINPDLSAAHHALATIRREIADAGELDRLREILMNQKKVFGVRRDAGLAMAKILDRAGRYDDAFAAAQEGNRLAREGQHQANIHYDHGAVRAWSDGLMRACTPEFFASTRGWGNPSELPVFIVGSFRTGSTLIEQICASHSQVHGAGELRDIPDIAVEIRRAAPRFEEWTPDLIRALAGRHANRLAALAPGKLRIVDKWLDNIYQLGLIAMMFPRARVIFTHRDGRDAAWSVFTQPFHQELGFATDLLDCGRRWHEAERMAAYWAKCLPLLMHHIQYETLVADFETEARKLIDFLGLQWEPACLEFYKTERAVHTASTWQVRQPLYDSSVGRWRNYAKHLQELCAAISIDPEAPTGARPADIT